MAGATLIFYVRNREALSLPNFYAEDGTIIFDNILSKNPLAAITTLFNGYLVIGQYLVAYGGYVLNAVTGGSVADLAKYTAVASYVFLGTSVSLPFVLFRRQLGAWLALLLVLVSACVPMTNSSFAIIGTIGNLKFMFVYIAFLLILYRNLHYQNRRAYVIDALVLVCVLTNVTVAFLLPFALWPYRKSLLGIVQRRKLHLVAQNPILVSLLVLMVLTASYIIFVYLHGIPPLPGYLSDPYQKVATLPIIDRATTYSWFYPITDTFRAKIVIGILAITAVVMFGYAKASRFVVMFALWSIAIATGLFVANRTGVSAYFLNYQHHGGPDQFFYAQNLIFIFLTFWIARNQFKKWTVLTRGVCSAVLLLFLIWAFPFGTTFGQARNVYQGLGTARQDVTAACRVPGAEVHVQIYPSSAWKWTAPRSEICGDKQ